MITFSNSFLKVKKNWQHSLQSIWKLLQAKPIRDFQWSICQKHVGFGLLILLLFIKINSNILKNLHLKLKIDPLSNTRLPWNVISSNLPKIFF